jgi:hypothetical protein
MSAVSIAYDLGQHGWSSFQLTIGDEAMDIGPFGYCSDALGDLVRAALLAATSGYRAEVCFDGEPQEWRLIVDEGWKPELRLRVLTFEDSFIERPEADGDLAIEGHVAADDFARAVQTVAQGIWETYGGAGYNEAWIGRRGFPLRGLKALDTALSHDEPPPKG